MRKPTISVVVSVWNEEKSLRRCLESIAWTDEIIVVDNASTDQTASIAKEFTSNVFTKPNNLMLNVNKNYGFGKAKGDWIISLDADEEIPRELQKEIRKNALRDDVVGFWFPRKNIIFGKWIRHGLWWPDKQLRMFRRGHGSFPERHVHEYLAVDGKTEELTVPYIHYNYESVTQFIRKMDTIYTESEVQKLLVTSYRYVWFDALRFPISDFMKVFFAQEGYKDGLHGLVLAIFQAFYSFVVFAKLWERQKFPDIPISATEISHEFARQGKEISYWKLTMQMKEVNNLFYNVWLKIKRRYG